MSIGLSFSKPIIFLRYLIIKKNQIHHYPTNYHVLKIFQKHFSFKNVQWNDFNFFNTT